MITYAILTILFTIIMVLGFLGGDTEYQRTKIFLTRIKSWKPVLTIFLIVLFFEMIIAPTTNFISLIKDTLLITFWYHLFISLPSSMLHNIKNKFLKVFIHFIIVFLPFLWMGSLFSDLVNNSPVANTPQPNLKPLLEHKKKTVKAADRNSSE